MTLREMIYKRKSCRSFTNVPADGAMLESFRFFKAENTPFVRGYNYICSVKLGKEIE